MCWKLRQPLIPSLTLTSNVAQPCHVFLLLAFLILAHPVKLYLPFQNTLAGLDGELLFKHYFMSWSRPPSHESKNRGAKDYESELWIFWGKHLKSYFKSQFYDYISTQDFFSLGNCYWLLAKNVTLPGRDFSWNTCNGILHSHFRVFFDSGQ